MKKGIKIALGVIGGLIVLGGIGRLIGGNLEKSNPAAPPMTSNTTAAVTTSAEVTHRTESEIIGVSNKDISDIDGTYYDEVRKDVTGKWRCLVIASNIDIKDYALSAYNTYIGDGSLLVVENLITKKCAAISTHGMSSLLFVNVTEYVDGEEHDAVLMCSGNPLASYMIYMDNGDIEDLGIEDPEDPGVDIEATSETTNVNTALLP